MAISETYVDPSIAGDSGAGTSGDPYGDLQYALDTMTRDSTNGDRINIKAGSDEVLTAALSLATYGTPTSDAPLIFQGYTSSAGDGGIGGISGNGSYAVFNIPAQDYMGFVDLHLHNTGSAAVITLDQANYFDNCEIDNTTGNGLQVKNSMIINCYIHNCNVGINALTSCYVSHCFIEDVDTTGIIMNGFLSTVQNCVIDLSNHASAKGITALTDGEIIRNNTIYSSSGTGQGIQPTSNAETMIIENNYIEGFSGVGGVGIDIVSGSLVLSRRGNRYYNNTTNENDSGSVIVDSDNSATASSALTDPGSGDFSVGTDLKAGAYPTSFKGSSTNQYMDIGAAQRQEPAATTNLVIQGRHNVLLRR